MSSTKCLAELAKEAFLNPEKRNWFLFKMNKEDAGIWLQALKNGGLFFTETSGGTFIVILPANKDRFVWDGVWWRNPFRVPFLSLLNDETRWYEEIATDRENNMVLLNSVDLGLNLN